MTSYKDVGSSSVGNGEGEDEIVEFENITVKFHISESQVVAQIYPNCLTIEEVKIDIGRKFEVDPKWLLICQCGRPLHDNNRLYDADKNEYGIYEFALALKKCTDTEKAPILNLDIYYNKSRLPDFITVHIPAEDTSDGQSKEIVVEIENQSITKPFIGGYKDRETGIEYHDAFTLTGPNCQKYKSLHLASRKSQTQQMRSRFTSTNAEETTQSFGDAQSIIFVTAATDFEIIPRKYETYAQKVKRENKLAKIILIQRNLRRYILWKNCKRLAALYRRKVARQIEIEHKMKEDQIKKRIYRENALKNFPHTKEDFGLLNAHVQRWKQAEMQRITAMYSGAARLAEINILLDKEIELLNGIERQRLVVSKAFKDYREKKLVEKLGDTIKWVGYKDLKIEMDLLRNQRVRFLSEIFNDLKKDLPKEERLKLLSSIETLLEDELCFPGITELYDLIERERNLLIKTKHCDVNILRQSINIIFLDLIRYNKDGEPKKEKKRLCENCKKVKPISEFSLRTRQSSVDTCQFCFSLKNASADSTVYRAILRSIQRDERKRKAMSSYAFILQEDDIRYIVDIIWHRHSFLSKETDIYELRLPRWNINEDWSPWNCISLTQNEAKEHIVLKNIKKVYDDKMILKITNRHLLAKNAFKMLQNVEIDLRNSSTFKEPQKVEEELVENHDQVIEEHTTQDKGVGSDTIITEN